MRKMKRVLAIFMIVAILFGGMVFGAVVDKKDLELKTTVNGVAELKISRGTPNPISSVSSFVTTPNVGEVNFSEGSLSVSDLYINVRTNKTLAYTINISGLPLATTGGATTKIGYTITPLTGAGNNKPAITVPSGATEAISGDLVSFTGSTTGMRVLSHGFSIVLNEADFANASDGGYTSILTINLVSN